MTMTPLQNSFTASELEAELRDLFTALYASTLEEIADSINVYGAPHLGPFELVERNIDQDGIAVLRDSPEANLRYVFKAYRYLNPERGLHFLRNYAQALFGGGQNIGQVWQPKNQPYPIGGLTRDQIDSESNYFLTSRIRVELDALAVPDLVVRAIRSVVAARFVLELRIAKFAKDDIGAGHVFGGTQNFFGSGEGGIYNLRYNGLYTHDGTQDYDGDVN